MATYSWTLQTRESPASPWRIKKMDTETSGLSDRGFLNAKAMELAVEYPDLIDSENHQITVHTWA